MKIIDLLNKVANGEEVPKKIKYKNNILYYDDDYTKEYPPTFNYYDEEGNNGLIEGWLCQYINDEVEIIEDKKIEKIKVEIENERTGNCYIKNEYGRNCYLTRHSKIIIDKLNEIIDHINKEDNK